MEEKIRLSKAIARAGVASRRKAEELIFAGRVTVAREVVRIPQTLVHVEEVAVDGKRLHREERVYFLLNKPVGYICSHKRLGKVDRLVFDLLPKQEGRLFMVGRLDCDTAGLLLLTNDGEIAHRITHPSFGVTKEYLVKCANEISHDHLVALSGGCEVEGHLVRPVRVRKVRRGTLCIVVQDGRKHEVRELVAHAGLRLLSLTRIRIGGLHLGKLEVGEVKRMRAEDLLAAFPVCAKVRPCSVVPAHPLSQRRKPGL